MGTGRRLANSGCCYNCLYVHIVPSVSWSIVLVCLCFFLYLLFLISCLASLVDPNIDLKSIFTTCLLKSLGAHLLRVKVEPNISDVSLANSKLTSHVVVNLFFNQSFFLMIQWPLIKNTFSTSLKPGIVSVVNWVILSIHSANICLKPCAHHRGKGLSLTRV